MNRRPVSSARRERRSRQFDSAVRRAALEVLEERRLFAALVVNTTADETAANSTTSLREAVAIANTNGEDDTITFSGAVFTSNTLHTITLTQGEIAVTADGGQTLAISGPGTNVLNISGNDASRVFAVGVGAEVGIADLKISQGRHGTEGGAIINQGTLGLSGVVLDDNHVVGSGVRGGAIISYGDLGIVDSFIQNNSADGIPGGDAFGGAIYVGNGNFALVDTSVSANFANGGDGVDNVGPGSVGGDGGDAFGGAIFIDIQALESTIQNSPMSGNGAVGGDGGNGVAQGGLGGDGDGGALWNEDESIVLDFSVRVSDTTFSSNLALGGNGGNGALGGDGGSAHGGAVVNDGSMSIFGGLINSNTAFGGAGGHNAGGGDGIGGDAVAGAVYNGGDMTLRETEFISNLAFAGASASEAGGAFGGAVGNEVGSLVVEDSSFTFNTAQGGNSSEGVSGDTVGGAFYLNGDITIDRTTIDANTAQGGYGGDGDAGNEGGLAQGGGVYVSLGLTEITNSTLSNNKAMGGAGGAGSVGVGGDGGYAYGGALSNADETFIANSTLYGNTAQGGSGGEGGDSTQGGLGGDGNGGAVSDDGTGLAMINVTVAENEAVGGDGAEGGDDGFEFGGGIITFGVADVTNTIVADNFAADGGPDLYGDYVLRNSLIGSEEDENVGLETGSADNLFETDPLLGDLENNGGPTLTALPGEGSDAIDAGNDALAEALLGEDSNDQRGEGFPRFIGTVDIGAVEVSDAQIAVSGNSTPIDNGDDTPSAGDHTDFGSAPVGAPQLERTFTVENPGTTTLTIFDLTLPDGYTLVEGLDETIAGGGSDTFIVALGTAAPGTFSGEIVIDSNANADAVFAFSVTGTITEDGTIHVNFQPAGANIPAGYVADVGQVFGSRGNGLSYGWNASAQSFTRDRNKNPDQRLDTLVHMQAYGNRTWEIAVPNGFYEVHLVAGDAQYLDSVYKINVEGVLTINGTPTSGNRFLNGTQVVQVTDGKLTVSNAAGSVNNKINYIDITKVEPPAMRINFQPAGAPAAPGYLIDSGSVFGSRGNGLSYGWNASASGFTRDRNVNPTQKFDTLIHMQAYGTRTWEIGVPNGTYEVLVMAGDPSYFDSVYKINVEGQLAVNGTPTSGNRFISGTKTVTVTDGKLTISNAAGSVNNKLAFVEITPL